MNMDPDGAPLLANEEGKTEQPTNYKDDSDPYQIHPLLTEENEKQVPHVTTVFGTMKQRLWQFSYPLGVIFANLVSMIFVAVLLHLPAEYVSSRGDSGDSWENFQYKALISIGLAMSLFTYLMDTILCRQGAQSVEQMVKDQNNSTTTSTAGSSSTDQGQSQANPAGEKPQNATIDIVKLSRRVDASFGCNQTSSAPQATFVVCLLYALYSVAAFQVATNATSLFWMHFMVPNSELASKGKCLVGGGHSSIFDSGDDEERDIASLQMLPEFGNLPKDVQKWVRQQRYYSHMLLVGDDNSDKALNRSLSYITMDDGSLVFIKATGGNSRYYGDNNEKTSKEGVVVYSPNNSGMKEYLKSERNRNRWWGSESNGIELIGFPSNPPYSGW